jgi:hypothetical protein
MQCKFCHGGDYKDDLIQQPLRIGKVKVTYIVCPTCGYCYHEDTSWGQVLLPLTKK